jgi:hypothetical protein
LRKIYSSSTKHGHKKIFQYLRSPLQGNVSDYLSKNNLGLLDCNLQTDTLSHKNPCKKAHALVKNCRQTKNEKKKKLSERENSR